jgi:hypothetical protein
METRLFLKRYRNGVKSVLQTKEQLSTMIALLKRASGKRGNGRIGRGRTPERQLALGKRRESEQLAELAWRMRHWVRPRRPFKRSRTARRGAPADLNTL